MNCGGSKAPAACPPQGNRRTMPADSRWRHVGRGAVMLAVGPPGNRTAAKVKIRMPRIAARPAADFWDERNNFFGGGRPEIGEGSCLDLGLQCVDGTDGSARPRLLPQMAFLSIDLMSVRCNKNKPRRCARRGVFKQPTPGRATAAKGSTATCSARFRPCQARLGGCCAAARLARRC
jgi:hypothetical protein